jgi:hypothetical protein
MALLGKLYSKKYNNYMQSTISTSKPMRIVRNTETNKIEFVALYITSKDGEHTLEDQLFEIDGSQISKILNEDETEVDQAKVLAHFSTSLLTAMEAYKEAQKRQAKNVKETVEIPEATHKLEV